MKLRTKLILIIVALSLIAFAGNIINSFYGNPFTKNKAKKSLQTYLTETYPDTDFELSKVTYNFKFDEYNGHIISPSSIDSHFMISWHRGKITYDSYEYDVVLHDNTVDRYEQEARDQVRPFLDTVSELKIERVNVSIGKEYDDPALKKTLVLDSSYDKSMNIPFRLNISCISSEPTYEEYAMILEKVHQVLIENGYHMASYSIHNMFDNSAKKNLNINTVTPEDIESGDLTNILKTGDQ